MLFEWIDCVLTPVTWFPCKHNRFKDFSPVMLSSWSKSDIYIKNMNNEIMYLVVHED